MLEVIKERLETLGLHIHRFFAVIWLWIVQQFHKIIPPAPIVVHLSEAQEIQVIEEAEEDTPKPNWEDNPITDPNAFVYRLRGHYLEHWITVELGRIAPDGKPDQNHLKVFSMYLPDYLPQAELRAVHSNEIINNPPEKWIEYILKHRDSKH